MPSISLSPQELYDAAARVAKERGLPLGSLAEELEPNAAGVVAGMVSRSDGSRALSLGLPQDESAESIVRGYADDYATA